jgi:hypothetical protein
MPRMTQKRILAWDRRMAAVHEAGHYVMAQLCGFLTLSAWIEPTPLCEEPSPCRGLRPHHEWKDRVGTWETSFGPQSLVDPGPRQEVEETKLSRNRRGVGRLRSTDEASNKAD